MYLSTTTISDTSQSTLSVRKPIIPDRSLKAKVLLRSSDLYEAGIDAQPDEIEQVCVHILTILLFIILSRIKDADPLSLNKVITFILILGIRSRT